MCACAEQKLSRRGERERCVCARAEQKLCGFRERERERDVCERAGKSKTSCSRGSTGDSRRLNMVWALKRC